jgi:hypothetical protein
MNTVIIIGLIFIILFCSFLVCIILFAHFNSPYYKMKQFNKEMQKKNRIKKV